MAFPCQNVSRAWRPPCGALPSESCPSTFSAQSGSVPVTMPRHLAATQGYEDATLTGSSGTTATHSGHAKPGSRFRACALRSFSNSACRPFHLSAFCGCRMTNAMARSPHFGCARATTDASRTSGCVASSVYGPTCQKTQAAGVVYCAKPYLVRSRDLTRSTHHTSVS